MEQNVAGSNLALCFDFFFFSLVEIFLSSCEPAEPFQHGASIACCTCFHSSIDLPNDIVDHLLLQIDIHLQECVTEDLQLL